MYACISALASTVSAHFSKLTTKPQATMGRKKAMKEMQSLSEIQALKAMQDEKMMDSDKSKGQNKADRSKAMLKSQIATKLSAMCKQEKKEMRKVLDALAQIATEEVKNNGKFTIPGVVTFVKRYKAACEERKVKAFGKEVMVKPKGEHYKVKAFPVTPFSRMFKDMK